MTKPQIAIIDFSDSHIDFIYTHASFLQDSGYMVHLICPDTVKERVSVFDKVDQFFYFPKASADLSRYEKVKIIGKYLNENDINNVVINTYSSAYMRFFLLYSFKRKIVCVLHSIEKSRHNFWFWVVSKKVKHWLVLSDHLVRKIPNKTGLHIGSLYPIFFPAYPKKNTGKKESDFWITIPGNLEYKRRNYISLLQEIDENLNKNIKFILLGRSYRRHGDGKDFEQRLYKKNLRDRFIMFDEFVDDAEFQSIIKESEILLPLLKERFRYLKEATSGTFLHSFAYKIPMVIESEFSIIEDLNISSFKYSDGELSSLLNRLYENRELIEERKNIMKDYKIFSYDYQKDKFISFINQ